MKYIFFVPILLLFFPISIFAAGSNFRQEIYPITQCNDGIDNDGDGFVDFAFDPDCTSWIDDNEFPDPVVIPPSAPVVPPSVVTPSPQTFPPFSPPAESGVDEGEPDQGGSLPEELLNPLFDVLVSPFLNADSGINLVSCLGLIFLIPILLILLLIRRVYTRRTRIE